MNDVFLFSFLEVYEPHVLISKFHEKNMIFNLIMKVYDLVLNLHGSKSDSKKKKETVMKTKKLNRGR